MDIDKVLKNHRLTKAVLGVTKKEFDTLLITFAQVLMEHQVNKPRKRSVGGGRNGQIKSPRNKLFFILWYLKVYPTCDVSAYVFSSSNTRTSAWVQEILPILEKTLKRKLALPKRKISTPEEFRNTFPAMREVMIDGVERPTIRSKNGKTQKKTYSGKKKRHTRKNLVVTDANKQILLLTPTKPGRVHDKKMSDKNLLASVIPNTVSILVDTGFQGLQNQHPNVLMPKKKPKGGQLTSDEKALNRLISSVRITVEHAIGGMKRFKAAADIFRNKNGLDDRFMAVTAGLWNLHIKMS